MSRFNIASKPKDDQDKVNVDLAASGVAYKERLNMPVIAEVVMREHPEHLRDYFLERLKFYREKSITLPKGSDPVYLKQEDNK
ncbi:DNA polymerase III subunit theta [Enterobacter hormaechei]